MSELPARTSVLVVGTGFAGLGTAVRLRQQGRRDFVVLERGDDVGGTWRDNSYPGCACDVPSHLYSFSFAPNPDWTRAFSPQPEIHAYLQRVAREHGVLPHIRFGTELLAARWDEATTTWTVETNRGTVVADVLVLGSGGLSEPKVPSLPGLERFRGTTFHSATWDHGHDLTGERVAVVGTGASAIQFVPHVQQRAAHLTLFQRTPPWVLPRRDRAISRLERRLYAALPAAQKLNRAGIYVGRESWLVGFTLQPALMKLGERVALRLLAKQVPDPALRARLTPTYRLGCKRVLLSNDYYPALTRPNVDVVSGGIVEVREHSVVDSNGDEHEVDTIVFGTGFHVSDPPIAARITGRAGTLRDVWAQSGMTAFHGTTVAGFPNLFFLVGPNTGLGHTSIVYMIESQISYLLSALDAMQAHRVAAVEPRRELQDAWNRTIQQDLQGTVWNAGGCSSWYLDEAGRNTTLWPTFTLPYRRALSRFALEQYETRPKGEVVVVTGAAGGLGAELSRQLTARGARLALLGLGMEGLQEQLPGSRAWECDVTDPVALERVAEEVRQHFGRVDVLVVNAGIGHSGALLTMDAQAYERVIEVNLLGSVRTVRAFLPALVESRGHVLQIASLAAMVHAPLMSAYAASKAGVEAMAQSLRPELAHLGVTVGVAYLAFTDTAMVQAADADPALRALRASLPGPFGRTYPVEPAVARIVDGLARRAPHVYAQGWLRVMAAVRGQAPGVVARATAGPAAAAQAPV